MAAADEDHLAKVMERVLDEKLANMQLQQPSQQEATFPQQTTDGQIPAALLDFIDQF
ncbi:MAG: hypothetical protein PHY12_01670 [Eubacteriales bacterium]|nr:hypothetical protein [Eubacteriales bacterium]